MQLYAPATKGFFGGSELHNKVYFYRAEPVIGSVTESDPFVALSGQDRNR